MENKLISLIESYLTKFLNKNVIIESYYTVVGGSISNAMVVYTYFGKFFVKYLYGLDFNIYKFELQGLNEILKSNTIFVPRFIGTFYDKEISFLILEYINTSKSVNNLKMESLGRGLALLHKYTSDKHGFFGDNFLGLTKQCNKWNDDWVSFYLNQRLEYQVNIAIENKLWNLELSKLYDRFILRLQGIIFNVVPSLIHGDLWYGNVLASADNHNVYLIDPAVYYGHREVDIAMTFLFGGFDDYFYGAYQEVYPLEKGYERRLRIYELYYILVHLNLFGKFYQDKVRDLMLEFV